MAADVSRDMFSKEKNYLFAIRQQAKVPMDADENDSRECLYWLIRDLGYFLGVDGFLGTGFKVIEYSADPTNNFSVTLGYGYYEGIRLYAAQTASRNLKVTTSQSTKNMASVVSAIEAQTLSDLRMNMTPHIHAGKTLLVFRKNGGLKSYTISDNDVTTITPQVGDDFVADGVTVGDYWMIVMTTPVADRTDLICLNIFKDQTDSNEDEALLHNLGGGYEADQRWKLRAVVEVVEDADPSTPLVDLPSSYVDFLGNTHYYVGLASVARTAGSASVLTANITDLRTTWNQMSDYVLKTGDTLYGNLDMQTFTISGSQGTVNFGAGSINNFNRIVSDVLFQLKNSDGDVVLSLQAEDNDGALAPAPSVLRVLNPQSLSGGAFGRVQAHYPQEEDDLTTMEYVTEQIESHNHEDYYSVNAVKGAMARLTETEALALVQAAYHVSYLQPNEYIDWEHDLGDEFIWFQVHNKPEAGAFIDLWIDGAAVLTVAVLDEDTVRIVNSSVSNIQGDRIRCCVMRTLWDLEMTKHDLLPSGAMLDTVVVTVT